ncbi:MAG: F0F1 ATP synthase subunit alpha, partial [Bacteroidetes bacterium]|nr:F0F1 ATP synthase subunit alpha [Bacteroidota bacterium]
IIFCGTRGLLRNVPIRSIGNFETEYLHFLEANHPELLKNLKSGQLLDDDLKTMERVTKELSIKYEEKK